MSGPELITLGCRLNIAESEAMRALAAGQDDLVIVNSCAVTDEAVRETKKAIRRARRNRPDARILVTGCAAQIDPASFARMPEVTQVIGNAEKMRAETFLVSPSPPHPFVSSEVKTLRACVSTSLDTNGACSPTFAAHARAFVEVQNGCDHRCTFCVIPLGRGDSRSVPAGLVIDRIRALVDAGVNEVVLTGVDVTSYGPDLPGAPTLGMLVERILRHVPGLPRLRLSSLDSVEIDDRLFDLVTGEPRVMPHLHLSLQAGDDLILKRMKRRHNRAHAVEMVARLKARRPEIAIGADLIAGFPTEDDAAHANSLALMDDCDIVFGHIFPYSPRLQTPAARMPQVDRATIKARAAALRAAGETRRMDWLSSLVGSTQRVLIENDGLTGHSENFARTSICTPAQAGVQFDGGTGPRLAPGYAPRSILPVRVTGVEGGTLTGISA